MKRCLLPLIVICLAQTLCAQAPLVKMWDKRFGGNGVEEFRSFRQTTDGGFILGGYSYSEQNGDKTQPSRGLTGLADFWIVKIDSLGNKQWDKRYGGDFQEYLYDMQQTPDGGYIIGGSTSSGNTGDISEASRDTAFPLSAYSDYWMIKVDALGNKQWDKRFGGVEHDIFFSLDQTTDKGYILGGYSHSRISGDKTQDKWDISNWGCDYWIVKTDSLGNKQWDRRFGGTSPDFLQSLEQTIDKGYILGGWTFSGIGGDKTQASRGGKDYWVVKIDSLGNKQWDRRYGGSGEDWLTALQQTTDRGYILTGWSESGMSGDKSSVNWDTSTVVPGRNLWVVKIDSAGNMQWDKSFGGISQEDDAGNIIQTRDKGYLLAGTSYSNASRDKSGVNLGIEQTWILKIDSLGNLQWEKTLLTTGHEENGFVLQTQDGSYVIANNTEGYIGGNKTQETRGADDYWIIKFQDTTNRVSCSSLETIVNSTTVHVTCIGASDGAAKVTASGGTEPYTFLWSDGQTDDSPEGLPAGAHSVTVTDANGCTATTSINIGEGTEPCVGIQDNSFNNITLHPNPTTNTLTITAPAIHAQATLTLVDALGKEVWQQIFFAEVLKAGAQLSLSEQQQGIYFLSIRTVQGARVMKVVKY